ncbi:MAG: hypothetical protein H7125_17450 [Proteobacteria bacterium]|nr:hypothetical protein [Burkholderiales bacterium]
MTMILPSYVSCPHCRCVLQEDRVFSGSTDDSILWSDGYMDAPHLPQKVEAVRCPSCKRPFFSKDAELAPYILRWPFEDSSSEPGGKRVIADNPLTNEKFYDIPPRSEAADLDALMELIAQTVDRDRLRYLRKGTWHLANHLYRKDCEVLSPFIRNDERRTFTVTKAEFNANIESLIALLEDDRGEEQVMKAEALREIGKHAEAIAALRGIAAKFSWVADQICSKAQAGESAVFVLHRNG